MRRCVVVDYGMGNLRSVTQAAKFAAKELSFEVNITSSPDDVRFAERIILPGQGAMQHCMQELKESGLLDSVLEAALNKPLLGICVGMQMLLNQSEEGSATGLGLIPGEVKKFQLEGQLQADGSRFKVPQMGWNKVKQSNSHALWQGINNNSFFYFVHSFYAKTTNTVHSLGESEYGLTFTSAIGRDNIFATQFHPEKSADQGLQLFRNFFHWRP